MSSASDNSEIVAFGQYRPDVSDYEQEFTDEILNVLPRGDGYGPFPSFSGLTNAITGDFNADFSTDFNGPNLGSAQYCRGFFRAINTDGSITTFAATSNRLYKLNTTNYTWTDVSLNNAPYSSVSSTDQWQFGQYLNFVIAVQANVPPQYFDLTSSTNFANLAGSPPQARYVAVVGEFVVLTGLLNNPYRIQWSALGDPAGWTAGVNSSDFQDLPDGGIVRGVAGGEYGNIFQDTVIRRMIYAPGSDVIFQIERISQDQGLYAPYSLIRSGDHIFWLSAKGFQTMAPTGYPQQIGKERVDRTILAELDGNNLQLCIGASDPRNSRVFWAYKTSTNATTGQFNKVICYDYALDRWAPASLSGQFIGSISQPGLTLENLDTISTSIDALPSSLDSFAVSSTPQIAMFNGSNVLGFLQGTALEAQIATSAVAKPGRRMFVNGFRPLTDAGTIYGSIGLRERLTDNETFTTENAMDSSGNIPARADTRYPRGKVRIPAGTSWTFATGIEPDIALMGSR